MKKIALPYHDSHLEFLIDEKNLKAVLTAKLHEFNPNMSEENIVRESLCSPIGTQRLSELSVGKNKIVLITSDHTRAVPSKITLPILLEEIRAGNPDADITILIATGLHRATTDKEQRKMFGANIVDNEKIVVSNAFEPDDFVNVCTLPSGAGFNVHKLVVECDLLIAEGFIEPHFFAGFSGGRKSVLPGVCSEETVNENHSYKAIANPYSKTGVLNKNPIHEDMIYASRKVNLAFIFNVALDANKKIIAAWSGDMEKAHDAGVEFIKEWSQCECVKGDIVITSNGGYPLDQNLYQSPKAVATAEVCCEKDAVIIMCCACADGMGGENFEKIITMGSPLEIEEFLSKIPPKETISEQWCPQVYSRILQKHKVILVSTYLNEDVVNKANMLLATTPEQALEMAYNIKGKDAKIVVIPDGVSVLAIGGE